ncbi:MAG: 1,4-dihydroxy-6-naphthoate synthase [Ginsengibacter sp.]
MDVTLGFSPCPNDTFIFDALVNEKIDTEGINFITQLEDVQTLNQLAMASELDVTKISYGVLPKILDKYEVLNSGSALGSGVGPLLIANENVSFADVPEYTIGIPGENTTAHLLFSLAFPVAKNKVFLRYDQIEDFVIGGEKQLGVIIHENRFTYAAKGLHKIVDLGNYWEEKTGYAIPLGGIVAKKSIDAKLVNKIDILIRKSIEYAFSNYPEIPDYVKEHSQEMDTNVMKQHIDLYVNEYSLDLGNTGKAAINKLLEVYNNQTE